MLQLKQRRGKFQDEVDLLKIVRAECERLDRFQNEVESL
jgi:hypothetical protein